MVPASHSSLSPEFLLPPILFSPAEVVEDCWLELVCVELEVDGGGSDAFTVIVVVGRTGCSVEVELVDCWVDTDDVDSVE